MLDTGHLLNTNSALRTEEEGVNYLYEQIKKLGDAAAWIKGIHLNCSLSGEYQQSHKNLVPKTINEEVVMQHVSNIDQHLPFTTARIWEVVNLVKPKYLIHELSYRDFVDFEEKIKMQLKALQTGQGRGENNA